jgi:hypothetical protein
MRGSLVASVLLAAGIASANGRAPATNGVVFRPNHNESMYVRSTFGLLVSHDDGCSFRWVCESAIGYGGEFDPKYAIATDGTIFATTFTGLRISRDGGCSWETATASADAADPGRIANLWIDGIDIASNGHVWVATAESAKPNNVYRSTDNGTTFTPMGLGSPTIWWKDVDVAETDPQRVYVTGYQVAPDAMAFLRRSDNAGTDWTDKPLTNLAYGSTPLVHVVALDPAAPDHFFLTSTGATLPDGDRLYETTNGGDSFTEVLSTTQPIRDVVIRPDGAVVVATSVGGTFQRAAGAAAFEPLTSPLPNGPDAKPLRFGCLGQRPDGTLIGCGANWQPDYMAIARAENPLEFEKVFRFVELAGTLACPAGTTSAVECDPMWPALQEQFGATGPTATCGLVPDPPTPIPPKPDTTGCCDTGGAAAPGAILLACGTFLVLFRRRRKDCCS